MIFAKYKNLGNLIKTIFLILAVTVLPGLCISGIVFAQAQDHAVRISPTRVVFEGRTRSATIKIINPNDHPQTYKISLVSIRMDKYGNVTEAVDPNEEEIFARNLIRFSPRRATIDPRDMQTVRLMVRKPRDLPEGEYRIQLKVEPVPKAEESAKKDNSDNISIKLDIVFHVSIPVIVRQGKPGVDVRVVPGTPRFVTKKQKDYLETILERKGKYSVYGDVKAFFMPSDGQGQNLPLGEVKGISIHAQNNSRIVYIPVENKNMPTSGKIRIDIINREKNNAPLLGSGSFDH